MFLALTQRNQKNTKRDDRAVRLGQALGLVLVSKPSRFNNPSR
ncbi:MAG: hypothetical protein ACRCYY_20265 [Trueperaceae bacterium]